MNKLEKTLFTIAAWIFTLAAMFFAGWGLIAYIWYEHIVILGYLFLGNFIGAIFTWGIVKDLK